MKKLSLIAICAAMFAACVSYKPVPRYIDSQKLPELALTGDSAKNIKVEIERTNAISGLPGKAVLAQKSQYVVPLPFVGFFGGKLLMKPGDTSLATPLYNNLETSLTNELATSLPENIPGNYELKVKVDSSNFALRYQRRGFVIWVFILQFGHKKEYCSPRDLSLSVSYELLNNGVSVKTGAFTKTSHSEEKVFSNTPLPHARPYDPMNPMDSPSSAAVRSQDAFAFGGIGGTISAGLNHAYLAYDDLIVEVSKQIASEVKGEVK